MVWNLLISEYGRGKIFCKTYPAEFFPFTAAKGHTKILKSWIARRKIN
jgi:hypothetical protein